MKKTAFTLVMILTTTIAHAWQFRVGGGLCVGRLDGGTFGHLLLTGWNAQAVLSQRVFVGRRWGLALGIEGLATDADAREAEALRIWHADGLWEWRVPLTYDFRPWLGFGVGVDAFRARQRYIKDALGYAIARARNETRVMPVWRLVAEVPVSAAWALKVSLNAAVGSQSLSLMTMSFLWRVF